MACTCPKPMPEPVRKLCAATSAFKTEATLQGTLEYLQPYFSVTLQTSEKSMANAIKFLDHPKAKQLDPKQTFNNRYVDEAMK